MIQPNLSLEARARAGRVDKLLLITGCGRSGTKYMSQLLDAYGIEVPHEKMGRNGTVNWCMAADDDTVPWGEPFRCYRFQHVFHQVRNPLQVIRSVMTFRPESWAFIARHVDYDVADPIILNAARYWLQWNALTERRTQRRYCIENHTQISDVLHSVGIIEDPEVTRSVSRSTNTRGRSVLYDLYQKITTRVGLPYNGAIASWLLSKPAVDVQRFERTGQEMEIWSTLKKEYPQTAEAVNRKAVEYGYDELPM